MDVQEFWQENKRWVLGVVAGGIVFLVARSAIESFFPADRLASRAVTTAGAIGNTKLYDGAALRELTVESDRLSATAASLRERVGFTPEADFVLAGKGDPDTYFPEIARRVRTRVTRAAQENAIECVDSNVAWASASGSDEIATRLLELGVLEAAAMRLIEASNEVRSAEPDAIGLQSIDALKIEGTRRSTGSRARGRKDADLPIDEYTVTFQFRCDVATLQSWLERLRAQRPALGIALDPPLQVVTGEQIGDPIRVKCAVQALAIRES